MSEVWILGLTMMLMGLLTVFLVLGCLFVIISLLEHFFGEKETSIEQGSA